VVAGWNTHREGVRVACDLGTIEPGKLAYLAFIAGNPLQHIKDLSKVHSIMKNGKIYEVNQLMTPFLKAPVTGGGQARH